MLCSCRFSGLVIIIFILVASACRKVVNIPNPINSITASQTFSSDDLATAATLGIYSKMTNGTSFSNSLTTIETGLSSDELVDQGAGIYDAYANNKLTALASSGLVLGDFWQPAYFDIYGANAVITGVQGSNRSNSCNEKPTYR